MSAELEQPELVPVPVPVPDGTETELVAVPEPAPLAELAAELEELDVDAPRVAIVVADHDDLAILQATESALAEREIRSETRVMSADEEPQAIADYAENARLRGIRVIVAGAGPAARLPTMIAIHTRLPVIGVPLTSQGAEPSRLDRLLDGSLTVGAGDTSEAAVAWVGLDDALAAAALAARILGG